MMNEIQKPPANDEKDKVHRQKNLLVGGIIIGTCILLYFITIIKIGNL